MPLFVMKLYVVLQKSRKLSHNDLLCEIANIEYQLPKHRKFTLHKYLKNIADNSDLKFQIEFFAKKGQKQAYSIRLIFDSLQLHLEGNKKNLFFKLLNERLRQAFDDQFPQWLTNREYDKELKYRIIRDVYKASFMSEHEKKEDLSLQDLLESYIKNLNEEKQEES